MNNYEESKLSMELAVDHHLKENTALTSTLPGFDLVYVPFAANLGLIMVNQAKLAASTKGWAEKKAQLKADLIGQTLGISQNIEVYAKMNDNSVLAEKMNISEWQLKRMPDTDVLATATMVHTIGTENLASLTEYDVTAAQLTALKATADLYFAALDTPRYSITQRKAINDEMKGLLKANDGLLEKLDLLMALKRTSEPAFYNTYLDNRKIIVTATRYNALRCVVKDATALAGLPGVELRIERNPGEVLPNGTPPFEGITGKTGSKGVFNLKTIPQGTYVMTATYPGFEMQEQTINVYDNILCEVEFLLVRIPHM